MESITTFITTNTAIVRVFIIVVGFIFTFLFTNYLIRKIVLDHKGDYDVNGDGDIDQADEKAIRDGYIIGKCENIIILSFVLAGEVTGLALIFAAKSLARQKDINDNAGFFLAGTMVNFTATLVIAFTIKYVLDLLPN